MDEKIMVEYDEVIVLVLQTTVKWKEKMFKKKVKGVESTKVP